MTRFSLSSILERKEKRGEESKGGKKVHLLCTTEQQPAKVEEVEAYFLLSNRCYPAKG